MEPSRVTRPSSCQSSKKQTGFAAISAATSDACRIESSMSGRSCSNVVAGSLVNHFGGKPSAVTPTADERPDVTVVLTNRCDTSVMLAMPYRKGKRVRVRSTKNSKGESRKRSATAVPVAEVQVTSLDQRRDLAIGYGSLEHPEAAIRVDVANAARTESVLGTLERPGDFVRCFNVVCLDIDHPDANPDA